jgi:hypothetical protein
LENPRLFYHLLFTASAQTLLQIAADPKHRGAEIGLISKQHYYEISIIVPRLGLVNGSALPNHFQSELHLPRCG